MIAAIGQALDPSELFDGVTLKLSEREYIAVDPITGQTSVEWIFAGGDAAVGPSSVIEAMAAGERAAVGIDRLLTGETRGLRGARITCADTAFDPDADPVMTARAAMKLLPAAKRHGLRRGGVHLGVEHGPGRGAALPALRLARGSRNGRREAAGAELGGTRCRRLP